MKDLLLYSNTSRNKEQKVKQNKKKTYSQTTYLPRELLNHTLTVVPVLISVSLIMYRQVQLNRSSTLVTNSDTFHIF